MLDHSLMYLQLAKAIFLASHSDSSLEDDVFFIYLLCNISLTTGEGIRWAGLCVCVWGGGCRIELVTLERG